MSKLTKEDNELLMKLIKRFPCYNTKYIDKYGVPICMGNHVKIFYDLFNPDSYTYGQVNYNDKLDKHYIELTKPIKYYDENTKSIINITELYCEKLVHSKVNMYQYCYIEKEKIEDMSRLANILDIDKYIKLIDEENFDELYRIVIKLDNEKHLTLTSQEKALFTKLTKPISIKYIKIDDNSNIINMKFAFLLNNSVSDFLTKHSKYIFDYIEKNVNKDYTEEKKIYDGNILIDCSIRVAWKYEIKDEGLNNLTMKIT